MQRFHSYFSLKKNYQQRFRASCSGFHGNLQQNPKYIDIFTDGNQIFITFLRPNTSKESYEGFTTNQIPL